MIIKNEPLSMAESLEYIGDDEKSQEIKSFMKKFTNIGPEEGKEIRKKIEELELIKVKPSHISKIIDVLPENSEELNKIFIDVSLDENETNKILDVVKQYK